MAVLKTNSSSIPGGIKETNEDEDSIVRHARDLYISDAIIHLRLLQEIPQYW